MKMNINKLNVSIIIAVLLISNRMDYISTDMHLILRFVIFAAGMSMLKDLR